MKETVTFTATKIGIINDLILEKVNLECRMHQARFFLQKYKNF